MGKENTHPELSWSSSPVEQTSVSSSWLTICPPHTKPGKQGMELTSCGVVVKTVDLSGRELTKEIAIIVIITIVTAATTHHHRLHQPQNPNPYHLLMLIIVLPSMAASGISTSTVLVTPEPLSHLASQNLGW